MRTWAYYGGKGKHADKIVPLLPLTTCYIEPCVGSGAIFFRKPLSKVNILNDKDARIVNLYKCIRDALRELREAVAWTPNSLDEFVSFTFDTDSDVENARQTLACLLMHRNHVVGSNNKSYNWRKGFATSVTNMVEAAKMLEPMRDRLANATIHNTDAADLVSKANGKDVDTLIYLDPPYMHGTRNVSHNSVYGEEMADSDHVRLLEACNASPHKIALSGYKCPLYERELSGWHYIEWRTNKPSTVARGGTDAISGAEDAVESLWLNYEPQKGAGKLEL